MKLFGDGHTRLAFGHVWEDVRADGIEDPLEDDLIYILVNSETGEEKTAVLDDWKRFDPLDEYDGFRESAWEYKEVWSR